MNSDDEALETLINPGAHSSDEVEAAATFLEVSINGADIDTLQRIALSLLRTAENYASNLSTD